MQAIYRDCWEIYLAKLPLQPLIVCTFPMITDLVLVARSRSHKSHPRKGSEFPKNARCGGSSAEIAIGRKSKDPSHWSSTLLSWIQLSNLFHVTQRDPNFRIPWWRQRQDNVAYSCGERNFSSPGKWIKVRYGSCRTHQPVWVTRVNVGNSPLRSTNASSVRPTSVYSSSVIVDHCPANKFFARRTKEIITIVVTCILFFLSQE